MATDIADVINENYHPNAFQARIGTGYLWVFKLGAALNVLLALGISIRYSEVSGKMQIALNWLFLFAIDFGLSVLNEVKNDHHITYFIGDSEYSIPWTYNPINGSNEPGGSYFGIHVTYPDLIGRYKIDEDNWRHRLVISKDDSQRKFGGSPIGALCDENTCREIPLCAECPLQDEGIYDREFYFEGELFFYYLSFKGGPIKFRDASHLNEFKRSVMDLFDSFKVELSEQ